MKKFRRTFKGLADDFQSSMEDTIKTHLDSIRATLDIIRSENAVLDSEQDPEFRGRVAAEIETVEDNIRRILAAIGL
jgi:hypothetical protein